MNSFFKSTALAVAAASVCGLAQADTFNLSGTFAQGSASPLSGGSYSGTYDFDGTKVGTFDVILRNSSGTVMSELSSATGAQALFGPARTDTNYDALFFTNSAVTQYLDLVFAAPFKGVGTVAAATSTIYSFGGLEYVGNGNFAYTTDGVSVAAVPEPATWGLMGLGLLGVGAVARRRKA